MIKADFHIHSHYSHDGLSSIEEIVKSAIENKLNVISVTDHDTVKGGLELVEYLKKNPSLRIIGIPGVEKTVEGGTHVLCLGVTQDIKSNTIKEVISEVKSCGGLVCIAHPYRPDTGLLYNKTHRGCFTDQDVDYVFKHADLVEAVNAKSFFENQKELLQLLKKYPKIRLLASSDAHTHYDVGNAFNTIENIDVGGFKLAHLREEPVGLHVYKREVRPKRRSFVRYCISKTGGLVRFMTRLLHLYRLYLFCDRCMLKWQYLLGKKKNLEKNRILKNQQKEVVLFKNDNHTILLIK